MSFRLSKLASAMDSLPDRERLLREIENLILANPKVGDVITGTGGVRKMRIADSFRGKGKRGAWGTKTHPHFN